MSLQTTASQTVGPYLHIGLTWLVTDNLSARASPANTITIEGRVLDGDGKPVNDALVEIWQANAHGKYAHPDDPQDKPLEPGFKGFGRVPTDDERQLPVHHDQARPRARRRAADCRRRTSM